MGISSSRKCRFFIGTTALSDPDTLAAQAVTSSARQTTFEAETYALVGSLQTIPDFGEEDQVIRVETLEDGIVRKLKGNTDGGSMALQTFFDGTDTGQQALRDAQRTSNKYAVKVTLNDGGEVSPDIPTTFYAVALVTSNKRGIGGANGVVGRTTNIEVEGGWTEVDAV